MIANQTVKTLHPCYVRSLAYSVVPECKVWWISSRNWLLVHVIVPEKSWISFVILSKLASSSASVFSLIRRGCAVAHLLQFFSPLIISDLMRTYQGWVNTFVKFQGGNLAQVMQSTPQPQCCWVKETIDSISANGRGFAPVTWYLLIRLQAGFGPWALVG